MKMKQKTTNLNRGRGRMLLSLVCTAALLCHSLPLLSVSRAYAEEEQGEICHVHTDSCYSTGRHLVCGLEENDGHVHTDACWGLVRGALLCTDNTGDHIHGDECYEWSTELICGEEEGEGAHRHSEDCYEEERILICGLGDEETAFSAEDYAEPEVLEIVDEAEDDADAGEIVISEDEPEIEDKKPEPEINPGDGIVSLLQMQRELHFADVSDPTADLEDAVDWWRMFKDMDLSGNWAEDLLMVADSQIGYTESELNFDNEDPWHPKGYTRYGAWFGLPYGEWCAMFISFCLYYAEIPADAVPYSCHCIEWVRELSARGLYRNWDEGYTPKPGDFIFFDFDMDEKAEHVGIVRDVDEERGWIYTIEGNRYDYVEEFVLTKNDYSIIGYGVLPENPNYDPWNPGVARQNGRVEIPPDPVEPTPPSWDNILDAAAGIKSVSITPVIEISRITY
jgi:CHAP domain.